MTKKTKKSRDRNKYLLDLTGDIVGRYCENNPLSTDNVPTFINDTHAALALLYDGEPEVVEPEKVQPKVSIRQSVSPDALTCMHCAQTYKSLKRHLRSAHSQTPEEYRVTFGLRPDYPMVAPNYSVARSALAKETGLGQPSMRGGKSASEK